MIEGLSTVGSSVALLYICVALHGEKVKSKGFVSFIFLALIVVQTLILVVYDRLPVGITPIVNSLLPITFTYLFLLALGRKKHIIVSIIYISIIMISGQISIMPFYLYAGKTMLIKPGDVDSIFCIIASIITVLVVYSYKEKFQKLQEILFTLFDRIDYKKHRRFIFKILLLLFLFLVGIYVKNLGQHNRLEFDLADLMVITIFSIVLISFIKDIKTSYDMSQYKQNKLKEKIQLVEIPNNIISASLTDKLRYAKELGVNMRVSYEGNSEVSLNDLDLTEIFSIIIDNAIETAYCTNKEVDIEVSLQKDFSLIVENTFKKDDNGDILKYGESKKLSLARLVTLEKSIFNLAINKEIISNIFRVEVVIEG